MPIDKVKVVEVHEVIRACFKGQIKSDNKSYALDFKPGRPLQVKPHDAAPDLKPGQRGEHWKIVSAMPSPEKRELRNQQLKIATKTLLEFRVPKSSWFSKPYFLDPVLRGFEVLNQKKLAGNCAEMADAAAFVVAQRKLGTPWIGAIDLPGDHVFCLVNGGETPLWRNVDDMKSSQSDAWIIDPWANICCKHNEYKARFTDQMRIWAHHGKRVWILGIPFDPGSIQFLKYFAESELAFIKCNGKATSSLPRALQKQRDAKASALPGAFGRWSPDDNWG